MSGGVVVAAVTVGALAVVGVALVIAAGNRAVDTAIAQAGLSPHWQADFGDDGRSDDEVLDAIGADDPDLADLIARIDQELARGGGA